MKALRVNLYTQHKVTMVVHLEDSMVAEEVVILEGAAPIKSDMMQILKS